MQRPPRARQPSLAGIGTFGSPACAAFNSPAAGEALPSTAGKPTPGSEASLRPTSGARFSFGARGGDATFSFGLAGPGRRLSLRKRQLDSPGSATNGAPTVRRCDGSPLLFGVPVCSQQPTPHLGPKPQPESNPGQTVANSESLMLHIASHMNLELLEARRLAVVNKTLANVQGKLPISDLDLSSLPVPDASSDTPNWVEQAIVSLSDSQKQHVQRLMCNPGILTAGPACFSALKECSSLGFLILSMQGCHLDMFASVADHWPQLDRLTSSLPALVCLDVSNCLVQDHHLAAIAADCHGLRALDVSYNPCITSMGVAALLNSARQLEELDLSACPRACDDQLLATIGSCCPALTSLYMEHDEAWVAESAAGMGLDAPASAPLTCSGLAHIAAGCPKLQVLSLAGQDLMADCAQDSSDSAQQEDINHSTQGDCPAAGVDAQGAELSNGLSALLHNCPALNCLNLTACAGVADSAVAALSSIPAPALQRLQLWGGQRLGDTAAEGIARCCTGLTSLVLHECPNLTDAGVRKLVQGCPDLCELQLAGCPQVSQDLSSELSAQYPNLSASINELQLNGGLLTTGDCTQFDSVGAQGLQDITNSTGAAGAAQGGWVDGRFRSPAVGPGFGAKTEAAGAGTGAGGTPGVKQGWGALLSFLADKAGDMHL